MKESKWKEEQTTMTQGHAFTITRVEAEGNTRGIATYASLFRRYFYALVSGLKALEIQHSALKLARTTE